MNALGKTVQYKIRRDVTNKKYWVVDVYFDERPYPNIISGRFTSKRLVEEAIDAYNKNPNKFPFWGNVN